MSWIVSYSSILSQRFVFFHITCMLCVLVTVSAVERTGDLVRLAGFAVRHMDDFSRQWREYYLEALWREEEPCRIRMKKCSYVLFACERM